ncbi:unnamed protein product, partial [Prorocentrum cordatum]
GCAGSFASSPARAPAAPAPSGCGRRLGSPRGWGCARPRGTPPPSSAAACGRASQVGRTRASGPGEGKKRPTARSALGAPTGGRPRCPWSRSCVPAASGSWCRGTCGTSGWSRSSSTRRRPGRTWRGASSPRRRRRCVRPWTCAARCLGTTIRSRSWARRPSSGSASTTQDTACPMARWASSKALPCRSDAHAFVLKLISARGCRASIVVAIRYPIYMTFYHSRPLSC